MPPSGEIDEWHKCFAPLNFKSLCEVCLKKVDKAFWKRCKKMGQRKKIVSLELNLGGKAGKTESLK